MEAIEFIQKYEGYIEEIEQVVKPELIPILDELKSVEPHDLVRPNSYFESENQARGLVWSLFISKIRIQNKI
jgi:hypothetical protein